MWRIAGLFVAVWSALSAQSISDYVLDTHKVIDLPVSREVTAVTLPGPITGIAGADMLIDDGRGTALEVDDGAPMRFQVSHAKGANFFLVQSLQPEASGTLTIIFDGAAYVLQLRTVTTNPVASAIFKRAVPAIAAKLDRVPEPVKFSPRIALSLLDRARAYPVLAKSLPKTVDGVTSSAQARKVDLPDVEIIVQEIYRFPREDAVVFLLNVRNKTDRVVDLDPGTFAARVANERFQQSIANGPRALGPGESAEAEFAIVGMPDGSRNDLSADNAFTVMIKTSRRAAAVTAENMESPQS
jgi:hypothetical protein